MTKTEWDKIRRAVERKGFAVLSDGEWIGKTQEAYGFWYKVVTTDGHTVDLRPYIDELKYVFD